MTWRHGFALLRAAASLALLALVFRAVDGEQALAALAGADPLPILGAVALVQVQILLSAWRWRMTAGRLGLPLSWPRAVGEYYVATFLNQVLPGGVAGDAVRAWRQRGAAAGGAPGWGPVIRAIVFERAAGQIAFFAVVAAGLLAWPSLLDGAPPDAALALAAPLLWLAPPAALLAALALAGPERWRRRLAGLGPDLRRAYVDGGAWFAQGALSLAIVASYIAALALAATALGLSLPPVALVTVLPLVLLTMLIPVAVGGWGVREVAAAALWPVIGLAPASGVASAVLYGLVILAGSLPGLVLLAAGRRQVELEERVRAHP